MLRYQVMKTVEAKDGTQTVQVSVVTIPDTSRGADQYLALKNRGFKLQRLDYQPVEER